MLKEKLLELNRRIINQATLVEKMLNDSIDGLLQKDQTILDRVISELEIKANKNELEIDELCINAIALYQPEARNLRRILTIQKMNNDLERMGDLAVNISERALYLIRKPDVKPYVDLPKMAKITTSMLCDSIDAFINEDIKLAKNILLRDDEVDDLQRIIFRDLIHLMFENPDIIKRSINLVDVSKYLERLADLSTNIAEDVIYMVKGKIVKHPAQK